MAGEFLTQLFWFKNFFEVIPSILKRKDNKKAGISQERVYFYVWLFFITSGWDLTRSLGFEVMCIL